MRILINEKKPQGEKVFLLSPQTTDFPHQYVEIYTQKKFKGVSKPIVVKQLDVIEDSRLKSFMLVYFGALKKFDEHIEEIAIVLGSLMLKSSQDLILDLDSIALSSHQKKLLIELLALRLYVFDSYLSKKKNHKTVSIIARDLKKGVMESLIESVNLTRNLVNDPANVAHPELIHSFIKKTFLNKPGITIKSFVGKELEKKGFGGIYNVGKGSQHDPRFVIIEYKGTQKKNWDMALVGKGVCFDAGGYNIKPTGGIEDMKIDMAGAATLLGVANYLLKNTIKKNVVFALPIVENLISDKSFKPGDIITMYNKKTVEIGNTDAEGRLILADALTYIERQYKPSKMIDIATLTGAQIVALGNKIAAVLGKNAEMNRQIQEKSFIIKERVRELPLYVPYFKTYHSHIADMNNISTRGSNPGTIGAALFLSQFVEMDAWAHLDIAGPSSLSSDSLYGSGATGFGVRLLIELIGSE